MQKTTPAAPALPVHTLILVGVLSALLGAHFLTQVTLDPGTLWAGYVDFTIGAWTLVRDGLIAAAQAAGGAARHLPWPA